MKSTYISLPISGHEEDYEQRLDAAVEYVKTKHPEYKQIITPKEVAEMLNAQWWKKDKPEYKDYLTADIMAINGCDAIFMCRLWSQSHGCQAEYAFAQAIGIEILWQPL